MPHLRLVSLLALAVFPALLQGQRDPAAGTYTRKNTFGLFGEYSNDSSRILLGNAQNRKLLNFGVTYSRRVLLRHAVDLQYFTEFRPVVLESDPLTHMVFTYTGPPQNSSSSSTDTPATRCVPGSSTFSGVYTQGPYQGSSFTDTLTSTCGLRQQTIGQGLSPVGLKLNLLPRSRLQPVLTVLGGELYTSRPIPIASAGSFNYTLEMGAGLELYRFQERSTSLFGSRSLRAEIRYHHISNASTATDNPGIDSILFHLTYAFGR